MVKDTLTKSWTKDMPMELVNHLTSVLKKVDELPSVVPNKDIDTIVNYVPIDSVESAFAKFMYGDGKVDSDEIDTFMEMVYEAESEG